MRHEPGFFPPDGARAAGNMRLACAAPILALACLLAAATAFASDGHDLPATPDLPLPAALSDDPLAHHPGFSGGNWFGDAFAGASSNYYLGRKLVRLPGGDIVVAGLVPPVGGNNTPGRWNLGLVRYDSTGQRVAWANPGPYGHFGNQYIVSPNSDAGGYTEVVDIVATESAQNRFFVLLNTIAQDGTPEVNIIAYDFAGTFQGAVSPFLNTPGSKTAAGLVYYREGLGETYKLVVIGTRFDNGKGRPVYRRYNAAGFGAETPMLDIHPTTGPCSTNIQNGGCVATAVTSVQWSAFEWLPPRIYVAGVATYNMNPDATNFFVTRIKGGDGTGVGYWDPSFGTGGTREIAFDAGGNNRDYATGIAARRGPPDPAQPLGNNTGDRIFVTGQVAQTCTPGIGVAAFNHDGSPVTAFGSGGKLRFGGQSLPCNQYLFESADYANAVTYDNDRLVIAGFSVHERLCFPPGSPCEDAVDPMIAVVRGRDGLVRSLGDFPVQPGNRTMHGGLYDVAVTGTGQYAVTGDGRYPDAHPQYPGRQEFITGRLRLDRIFGNGVDCGGGYPDPAWSGCN